MHGLRQLPGRWRPRQALVPPPKLFQGEIMGFQGVTGNDKKKPCGYAPAEALDIVAPDYRRLPPELPGGSA
jgi:hypothetical protein